MRQNSSNVSPLVDQLVGIFERNDSREVGRGSESNWRERRAKQV